MLIAVDFDEYLINVERVTEASVFSFQSSTVYSTELDAPEADCFAADGDASFCEEIFDISMAEVESVVEPDSLRNDIRRKSVTFICIHGPSLAISAS